MTSCLLKEFQRLIGGLTKYTLGKNRRWDTRKRLFGKFPMTICLAVISDINTDSPKIVFAADRLVTMGICFESGVSKIIKLTDYAYVAVSSNQGLASDSIVKRVQERIEKTLESKKNPPIDQIVEWFSIECKDRLKSEMEREALFQYDLTYEEFKDKSKDLHEDIVRDIIDKFDRFEYGFGTSFLIVSIENTYPYIFTVDQNGDFNLWNSVGFATIGEGAFLAHNEITKFPYDPNMPIAEIMPLVYYSKKASERTSGIGENTDLAVLFTNNTDKKVSLWVVDSEIKKLFDREIEEMRENEKNSYKKMREKFINILNERESKNPDVTLHDS